MERTAEPTLDPSRPLLEVLTRTLRHEVGDLLQTVYATVAILQERLPASLGLERRLVGDLRSRAELCKHEIDAVHDLVCPLNLSLDPLDLAELCSSLAAAFTRRYPDRQVRCEAAGPLGVRGDTRRLNQVGQLLVHAACHSAQKEVVLRAAPVRPDRSPGLVEWVIEDDGPGATPEQLSWLDRPFTTTQHALFGLGLALARRVAEAGGGSAEAGDRPGGGVRVRIVLPALSAPGRPAPR
jgi:signal transduction histidine kinase